MGLFELQALPADVTDLILNQLTDTTWFLASKVCRQWRMRAMGK
jgi:hypothetical protein